MDNRQYYVAGLVAALLLGAAPADAALIDTSGWLSTLSPSSNRESTSDPWIRLEDNTPTRASNASGTLVSDFILSGDFAFRGRFSPIVDRRSGSSCDQAGNAICNDNDILGLVFGWQDERNHYRLGFGQGGELGVRDITGRQGLFLVREIDGSSNTLFSWDSSFWVDDAVYEFSIGREREEVSVSVAGLMRSTPGSQSASKAPVSDASATYRELGTSVEDSVFLDGRIGVYTESQASRFSQLSVTVDGPEPDPEASSPNAVPAPATFLLLVSGMSLLRRRLGIARR